MNKSDYLKKKHSILKGCAFFLLLFSITTSNAQEIYVRVSEKDCINCYAGFFSELLDHQNSNTFHFLFPKDYQGKRFEKFNNMYMRGKVLPEKVIFSDSLFQKTKKDLNGLSGIVLMNHGEVLVSLSAYEASRYSPKKMLDQFSKTQQLLDLNKEGVSARLSDGISYKTGKFMMIDGLFRTIYFWKNNQKKTIDLKSEVFQEVLEENLTKEEYASHKKYRTRLKEYGKNYPETFFPKVKGEFFYLEYMLPYILKTGENTFGISNMLLMAKLDLKNETLSAENIAKNTYRVVRPDDDYYPTYTYSVINDKFYFINQMIYTEQHVNEHTTFPLFSEFVIDKKNKNLVFDGYSKKLENFSFQEDSTLNSNEMIIEISFLNFADQVLLKQKPYAVDIGENKKYELDWNADMNDIHYSQRNINYKTIQFWKDADNYVVLVKIKNDYFMKVYDKNWELKKELQLPFNTDVIKKLRFTKNNIYVFTENEILKMNNFVADRLKSM